MSITRKKRTPIQPAILTGEDKKRFNKDLLTLAVPLALQNLLGALVGASDALMLGRLNQASIAAVSLANQISFVMSLFTGSVIGTISVLIAQYMGKGDQRNTQRFFAMGIRYAFGISVVFFLLAFCIPEQLMRIFTPEEELIRIGSEYLRIVSFSYLFMGISQPYLMVMRTSGRVKTSLWISAVTVIVDMTADFFLIYGVGSWKGLGANGSAYSTIAVEAIALCICIVESMQKDHIHPDRSSMRFFSKAFERDIWKVIPGMLASALSWGLSMTMHQFILGHMGTDATAAASVTGVATQMIQCVSMGLAAGGGIILGKMLGRDEFAMAKAYGKRFFRVSFINGLINAGLLLIVGPLVYAFAYNTIYTVGVFPAGGDSRYDAISVIIATWCFAIPLSLLGCFVFHWPVMVVYMVMCCDEIIKFPFIYLRFNTDIWVKNLTRSEG